MGRRKMRGPTKQELKEEAEALRLKVYDLEVSNFDRAEELMRWKKAYGDLTLKLQKAHMKLGEIVCRK